MLDWKLEAYAQSNIYPFHMPGHKRRMNMGTDPYRIDITEIDGFDNLHHAEDVLRDAQQRAAALYGSKKAYYLVNGSTCGLLAAVSAAAERGGEILVARNCHKAVYHAIYLRGLTPHYLYPEITDEGIACAVTPDAVQKALEEYPDTGAVLLTSPTYDGVVSDIARIAEVVHRKGIPLIVDEAHGAHFGISGGGSPGKSGETEAPGSPFPTSAVTCGADLVVQSLHKTLPSFTQTALLHICSDLVPARRVEQFLDIFETSSPSYVLMAGMERCIRMMAEDGDALLRNFRCRLDAFAEKMKGLSGLRLLTRADFPGEKAYDFDASKLLIYTGDTDITGKQLYDMLLQEYELQPEMAAGNYVLAMTSIMDTEEGFERLAGALLAIDRGLAAADAGTRRAEVLQFSAIYAPQEQVCTTAEAVDAGRSAVPRLGMPEAGVADQRHDPQPAGHAMLPLDLSAGQVAADFLYLYPPGIPLLAPGERVTEKTIRDIRTCRSAGLTVHGLTPDLRIEVVKFS
jgi:arginine/lysine/ornithine decarboxylase